MRKQILIVQHYSPNIGNSAVLCSLLDAIHQHISDVNISVSSFDPTDTTTIYGVNAIEWPIIVRNLTKGSIPRRMMNGLYELFQIPYSYLWTLAKRLGFKMELPRKRRITLNSIATADLVICPGGHLFTNFNRFPVVFSHLFPLQIAIILKKKVVILGQTIGPFFGLWGKISGILTNWVLRRADYITVREDNSLGYLLNAKIDSSKYSRTGELVFLMPESDRKRTEEILAQEFPNLPMHETLVGVVIHHIYFKYWFSEEEYIDITSTSLRNLIDEFDCNVVFISMEYKRGRGKGRDREQEIVEKMMDSIGKREKVYAIMGEYTPLETLGIVGEMDYLIATKAHSIIFGLRMAVPTLAIAYQQKSREFMRDFGLEQYVLDMSKLDSEKVRDIFRKLYEDRDYVKRKIEDKLKLTQNRSLENIEIIRRFINV